MRALLLLALAGCFGGPATDASDTGADTGGGDSGASDSGDSGGGDSGDSGTGDSGDSGSGDSGDSGDTGPTDRDGDGYASDVDCDDGDASVHPGADERCNGHDDDCDGAVDDDDAGVVDARSYYRDEDDDAYGVDGGSTTACSSPGAGWATRAGDCDDAEPRVNPGATEICNETDDDCDGEIDEGFAVVTWYYDRDGDGWGRSIRSVSGCRQPTDFVAEGGDCDDGDAEVYPGAPEQCNDEDDDCDGSVDEDLAATSWYRDWDSDGYGDFGDTRVDCAAPDGYVADATDCDDYDPTRYPDAVEECDGEDDDCDNAIDEDCAT